MKAGFTRGHHVAKNRRPVVVLTDQLDLHVAGLGDRGGDIAELGGLAAVTRLLVGHFVEQKERTDTRGACP
jgi:hypothetical protein